MKKGVFILCVFLLFGACVFGQNAQTNGTQFIHQLFEGKTSKAHAYFDENVKGKITPEKLGMIAQQIELKTGDFQKIIAVHHQKEGKYLSFYYYAKFARKKLDIKLVFSSHKSGIIGFFFMPHKTFDKSKSTTQRPQEPKKPYPYITKEVTFKNPKSDLTLAGTLTLPKEGKNFPAVILISGSGPQNRDEELLGHKPFLVIADYLTRHGIAVLRYDDRGVGKSTGEFEGATTADFTTDAAAAFRFLQTQKAVNPKEIGLLGHSEGGVIAPMVAAKHPKVDFIVLLAGTGVNGGKVLLKQQKLSAQAKGISDTFINANYLVNKKAYQLIAKIKDSLSLRKKLKSYFKTALQNHPVLLGELSLEKAVQGWVKAYMDPWMRYFIRYNPAEALKKVSCPVLALNGGNDLQVSAQQNLPAIKAALQQGGNDQVTTKVLPGLNHLFQKSKTGLPSEYRKIEMTFSPQALKIITDWILKIFN